MPHFTIEYSANGEALADIQALTDAVHNAALETGVFPLKGIRTRCARRETYRIADGHPDNLFVHVVARIRAGRPLKIRMKAGDHVFEALCGHLQMISDDHPIGISFEIQEIDPDTSWKRNTIEKALAVRARKENS